MNDSQKLEHIKAKFHDKIEGISTLAELRQFILNITRAKVIGFLKQQLTDEANKRAISAEKETEKKLDFGALRDELDELVG